ncbi:hypothetical protein H0H93_015646 [Arthromyces matolae]|nr:hypothetical protein H0H93_015646 [Arthromyces matolae]
MYTRCLIPSPIRPGSRSEALRTAEGNIKDNWLSEPIGSAVIITGTNTGHASVAVRFAKNNIEVKYNFAIDSVEYSGIYTFYPVVVCLSLSTLHITKTSAANSFAPQRVAFRASNLIFYYCFKITASKLSVMDESATDQRVCPISEENDEDEYDFDNEDISIEALEAMDRIEQQFLSSKHDSQPTLDLDVVQSYNPSEKRSRGRPKHSVGINQPKRPRGRPPGTGSKSKSQKGMEGPKRPVGRPPKAKVPLGHSKYHIRGLFVPGTGPQTSQSQPPESTPLHSQDTISESTSTPSLSQPSTSKDGVTAAMDSHEDIEDIEDSDEEEGEIGLSGEGIGVDDEEDEDEDDDEQSMPPKRSYHLPRWLKEIFDQRVHESGLRGKDGLPPLYRDHHTFWFPRKSNYFVLREPNPSPTSLYNYEMFLWDPEPLLPFGIPCPNCSTRLYRHGHISRPRRCIDLSRTIWIIGYRYRCPVCINPSSEKCTVTFRSWDPRILTVLPKTLATEFPAHITCRSAMSHEAMTFMRSCTQHGMGSKQFSNALRAQHLQIHDEKFLQYLHLVASRKGLSGFCGQTFEPFLPFSDHSDTGFWGFVPSAQWLRDVYDSFIESHRDDFNQHTAMLSGTVCAVDHSFKLAKQVAKINGIQVFTALLSVTNEKGELRVCDLVPSKAHSDYEPAMHDMNSSLELYGHDPPMVFYTDTMIDKEFLERCFPSLRDDVVPVEKYAHLPPVEIPSSVDVSILQTVDEINEAMRSILQLLPDADGDQAIVIALDSEWNVEVSDHGYVAGRGQTAIIQIAISNQIYVLQVGKMLAAKHLPQVLKQVLENPRILKVGRCVMADLKYLEHACGSSNDFCGAVDLARYAKDRQVVRTAKIGLAELSAIILKKRLNKDVPERLSTNWENESLTPAQIRYAAKDVYASLLIYDALSSIPIPAPLRSTAPPLTPVLLFNEDNTRVIARGVLSANATKCFDGINITANRCLAEIEEVYVPGAIITTHKKQALNSFGSTPFSVVCLRSHLKSASSFPPQRLQPTNLTASTVQSQAGPSSEDTQPCALPSDPVAGHEFGPEIGELILDVHNDATPIERPLLNEFTEEEASRKLADEVLKKQEPQIWSPNIRSRVLKDPFHVFNQFYISVAHGLRVDFSLALRDAIFIPDIEDKQRIIAWGASQNPPLTWEVMLRTRAKWLWRHCKRTIPPPEQLHPLVEVVFRTYGPLKDAKSGLPLFNSSAWNTAKNILDLIRKGYLSDPPGVPLYYRIGVDKKAGNLPIYRCFRGTTMTEGGVHTHLRSRLPTSGVSVRHVHACLLDFILRHNLLAVKFYEQVGTLNSTGKPYVGHYSIWLTNELQEMIAFVQDVMPLARQITNWVNGNLYKRTTEVSGVLPVPLELQRKAGMVEYQPELHRKQLHSFLASLQGTRKPVLPIHNDDERNLFRNLMARISSFSSGSGVDWEKLVKVWNGYANEQEKISYKLTEHLTLYYNGEWATQSNVKQTLSITAKNRVPLKKAVHDPNRSIGAPQTKETSLKPHVVSKGLLPMDKDVPTTHDSNINSPHPAIGTTSPQPSLETHIDVEPEDSSNPPTSRPSGSMPSGSLALTTEVHTRLLKRGAEASTAVQPAKKQRRERSCQKCSKGTSCPGRKESALCPNRCKDCGKYECKGRNSKKPNKLCHLAWE